jgi:hypothetical protein
MQVTGSHPLDRVIEADTVGGCLCFHTSAARSSVWILGWRPKMTGPTSAAVSTSTRTHGTCTNMTVIKRPLRWMRLVHPAPQILPGCGRQRLRPMAEMDYAECSRCAEPGNLGRLPGGRPGSGAVCAGIETGYPWLNSILMSDRVSRLSPFPASRAALTPFRFARKNIPGLLGP